MAQIDAAQDAGSGMPPLKVFRVAVENIMPLWPQLRPLILTELRMIPTHDEEDVRKLLLSGAAHLWIQWSGRVEAMAITDFYPYPKGLALRMWLGAAYAQDEMDWQTFQYVVHEWAAANQCRWLEGCGRIGWLRRIKNGSYNGVFIRVPVDGGAS